MNKVFVTFALIAVFSSAGGAEKSFPEHRPIAGVYKIYGGGLGDETLPTKRDKKIMFSLTGTSAKNLFNSIGPDVHDICTEGQGIRVRRKDKGRLSCLRETDGQYRCNFGFDLTTGRSIGGSVC